jgi:hypothetical protein
LDKDNELFVFCFVLLWDELNEIERHRQTVRDVKQSELPFARVLFFWDGTILLQALSQDLILYSIMTIYVLALQVGAYLGLPDFVARQDTELS